MKNDNFIYHYRDNLKSKRLVTRFLNIDDIENWSDFFKDKEAIQYFLPFEFATNKEIAEYWIKSQIKRYEENQFGLQALINKKTNDFIGQCGLVTQEVDGIKEIEVGYHIMKKYWGNGFAPEAAKLFSEFAFENNISKSIISIIHKENLKSQKVGLKNGLIREKETKWKDINVYIYRIENNNKNKY